MLTGNLLWFIIILYVYPANSLKQLPKITLDKNKKIMTAGSLHLQVNKRYTSPREREIPLWCDARAMKSCYEITTHKSKNRTTTKHKLFLSQNSYRLNVSCEKGSKKGSWAIKARKPMVYTKGYGIFPELYKCN